MGRRLWVVASVLGLVFAFAGPPVSAGPRFKIVDVPGASNTQAFYMNDHGTIDGTFSLPNDVGFLRGFVRTKKGRFHTFMADPGEVGIQTLAINRAGAVVGYFHTFVDHGFVRSPAGHITTFDCPLNNGTTDFTQAFGINNAGTISGTCTEAGVRKAFVRDPSGSITTFIPGGGTAADGNFINNSGAMTGDYVVAGRFHGFIRKADGSFILPIDADLVNGQDTLPETINDAGAIAGAYTITATGDRAAFYRDPSGAIRTFTCGLQTVFGSLQIETTSITRGGSVLGSCVYDANSGHGFKWTAGTIRTVEPPGASGSIAVAESRRGLISGTAAYPAGETRGFIATGFGR